MFKRFSKKKYNQGLMRSTTIGILGLSKGVGTTHIGLIIAGFLHAYYGRKTLYAECFDQNMLHHWLNTDNCKQNLMRHGIMYMLSAGKEDLPHIKNMGYTYCVIDFGSNYTKALEELMRCDIKIIVGIAAIWQKNMWKQAEDIIKEVKDSSTFYFLSNFGDISDDIKKKLLPAKTYSMPYEPDMSRISNETVYLFRRIFKDYS